MVTRRDIGIIATSCGEWGGGLLKIGGTLRNVAHAWGVEGGLGPRGPLKDYMLHKGKRRACG